MMLKNLKSRIISYLILQLFISLMALPILIAWGLPFAMTSLIATALFAPFFTLFLTLASLIFFTTIAAIPNYYLMQFLDLISQWWLKVLSWDYGHIMIPITAPPTWTLIVIPCTTLAIFITTFPHKPYRCLIGLSVLLSIVFSIGYLMRPYELTLTIPCHDKHVLLLRRDNKTILIDPGYIGRRNSAPSWIQYTLITELVRKTGSLTIDHVIALAPNQTLFKALAMLWTECQVKNLYIPKITGNLPPKSQFWYDQLIKKIIKQNTQIHKLDWDTLLYPIMHKQKLFIKLEPHKRKTYRESSYPICHVFENEKIYS